MSRFCSAPPADCTRADTLLSAGGVFEHEEEEDHMLFGSVDLEVDTLCTAMDERIGGPLYNHTMYRNTIRLAIDPR